jgi:hypothetical protein
MEDLPGGVGAIHAGGRSVVNSDENNGLGDRAFGAKTGCGVLNQEVIHDAVADLVT